MRWIHVDLYSLRGGIYHAMTEQDNRTASELSMEENNHDLYHNTRLPNMFSNDSILNWRTISPLWHLNVQQNRLPVTMIRRVALISCRTTRLSDVRTSEKGPNVRAWR